MVMLFAVCMTATAESGLSDTQRAVGQTMGDAIEHDDAAFGQAATYKVAAILPESQLKAYVGCDIIGIRFALGMDMSRSSVFLSSVNTNTGSISEELINQSARYPSAGWNNIFFNNNQRITITGEEGFLYGFEYTESATMVANEQGALCINGENKNDYGFFIYGNFGQGTGWYSSDVGNLCVQLIVDVTNMPGSDVSFTMLTTGHKYKKVGDNIDFYAMYDNAGRDAINSIHFAALYDGVQAAEYDVEKVENAGNSLERILPVPESLAVGKHTFTLRADKINGETLAEPRDISESFVVYDSSLGRQKHYIEQYMSQKSTYTQYTDVIMNEIATRDKACLVNLYGQNSLLGIDEAYQYIDRYAYDYPCFTLDRSYFPGEAYVAYDVNYYASVVPEIMVGVIDQMLSEQDFYPAFATIDITPAYDPATRTLEINVDGDLIEHAEQLFGGNAVLTVMLTENNVQGQQQVINPMTNRPTTKKDYMHQHVLRKYLSDENGDALDLSSATYGKHYLYQIPQDWKAEDLEVVAIITKGITEDVTEQSIRDYDVTNANSVALSTLIDGIQELPATDVQNHSALSGIYNLHGQRLSPRSLKSNGGIVISGGRKYLLK